MFEKYDIQNQLTRLGIYIHLEIVFIEFFSSTNSASLPLRDGSKNEFHQILDSIVQTVMYLSSIINAPMIKYITGIIT